MPSSYLLYDFVPSEYVFFVSPEGVVSVLISSVFPVVRSVFVDIPSAPVGVRISVAAFPSVNSLVTVSPVLESFAVVQDVS